MMKRGMMLAVVFGLSLGFASRAFATTYPLNCGFSGPETAGVCSPIASAGTVTLTQNATNANWVDIAVNVTVPGADIVTVYLNFPSTWTTWSGANPILGGIEYEFQIVGASQSIGLNDRGPQNTVNGNCQNSPVWNCQAYRYFDYEIDPSGAALPTFNGTIKLVNHNNASLFYPLTPGTFDNLTNDSPSDDLAKTYVGVRYHLLTQPSGTWVAVGSLPSPVPEPATLLLLGTGLVFVVRKLRRT